MKCVYQIPERFKGDWCKAEVAELMDSDSPDSDQSGELNERQLRECWAKALLAGDMKTAHRAWGRWQGFTGGDPWEDPGWRSLWEAQRKEEQFWQNFESSMCEEKVWLRMFISYWEGAASLEG